MAEGGFENPSYEEGYEEKQAGAINFLYRDLFWWKTGRLNRRDWSKTGRFKKKGHGAAGHDQNRASDGRFKRSR